MLKINIQNINFGYYEEGSVGTNKIITINFTTGNRDVIDDISLNGSISITMEDYNSNIGLEALKALVLSKLKERINIQAEKPETTPTNPE